MATDSTINDGGHGDETPNHDTKRLIAMMQDSDAVCDPNHYHSFQSVSFLLLPIHSCSGCGQRLATSMLFGSNRPLQCVACGSYSHRSCAFSKSVQWTEKCRVNFNNYNDVKSGRKENNARTEGHTHHDQHQQSIGEMMNVARLVDSSDGRPFDPPTPPPLQHDDEIPQPSPPANTDALAIFRASRQTSLLDSSEANEEHPKLQSARSEDGISACRRWNTTNPGIQYTKAPFPFLSTAKLFHKGNSSESETGRTLSGMVCSEYGSIQKSKTWTDSSDNTVGEGIHKGSFSSEEANSTGQSRVHSIQQKASLETPPDYERFIWKPAGPISHWSSDTAISEITKQAQQIKRQEENKRDENETAPLHFASGFLAVSKALQENIIATFGRLVSKEELDEDNIDSGVGESDGLCRASESNERKDVHRLLEESRPSDNLNDKTRIGIGYVAGGVAGGLAGLVLAGPAGGLIGIKFGQLGAIGMLLEGSFTVGALAGGVAAGQNIGKHLDEKLNEARVLALGEGSQRQVLLLIRPSIQNPDAVWEAIHQDARRRYPGDGSGFVQRLISSDVQAAKRERYAREVDIVEVAESELPATDKVLLLVSRILNNKDSLPGHLYRELVVEFRKRANQDDTSGRCIPCLDKQLSHKAAYESVADLKEPIDNAPSFVPGACSHNEVHITQRSTKRRQDAHAVIKYVTAALLETRPGFGCSAAMTEMTATAVESLVFGEVYDMVMEEIVAEKELLDEQLLTKINYFEHHRKTERTGRRANGAHASHSFSPYVSAKALSALYHLPDAHSAVDKLRYCVLFLEEISDYLASTGLNIMGADFLLPVVCQHVIAAKVPTINAEISFLEEFARDEQLLRGREGYSLVTLQAALHYLNSSENFHTEIFFLEKDSAEERHDYKIV